MKMTDEQDEKLLFLATASQDDFTLVHASPTARCKAFLLVTSASGGGKAGGEDVSGLLAFYRHARSTVISDGFQRDIDWASAINPPTTPYEFACEVIFVICNSGMKATVAARIFRRVISAKRRGLPATSSGFGHALKCRAIDDAWAGRKRRWRTYMEQPNDVRKLAFLGCFDHVGPITVYHLAKNFGLQVAKPDRHLARICEHARQPSVQRMCESLAEQSGDCVPVVDMVLWRYAEQHPAYLNDLYRIGSTP